MDINETLAKTDGWILGNAGIWWHPERPGDHGVPDYEHSADACFALAAKLGLRVTDLSQCGEDSRWWCALRDDEGDRYEAGWYDTAAEAFSTALARAITESSRRSEVI